MPSEATTTVLGLSPAGYWKLADGTGAGTAAALAGSAGTYVGTPTLNAAGRVQAGVPTAGGTGATCLTTASGKYLNLGTLSGLMAAILSTGATVCGWMDLSGSGISGNLLGGFEGASAQGFGLTLVNAGGGGDSMTLTVKDNAGTVFSRQFKRAYCRHFNAGWVHVTLRMKLTQGASSSAGTLEVLLGAVPLAIDTGGWGDVATNNTVGAMSELSTGKVLVGNIQTGATPGTAIAAKFQEIKWYPTLLTDAQVATIAGAGVWDGTIGAADPAADFDLTDRTTMFLDTAGTLPVTAAGQEVLRVNAVVGPPGGVWLEGTAGRSAIWNGETLELDNRYGSSGPTTRGMEIKGLSGLNLRQVHMALAMVYSPITQVVNTVSDQYLAHLTGTGAGATLMVTGDGQFASLAGQTAGSTKTPITPAAYPLLNTQPAWNLVVCSFGANGNAADTVNPTNLACAVNGTVSTQNTNAGDTTRKYLTNGNYYNQLTAGWFGIGGAPGAGPGGANYATAASFRARRLVIYERALSPTAEMPRMLAGAAANHQALADTAVNPEADLYCLGDSLSCTQDDDGSPAPPGTTALVTTLAGYQGRLSSTVRKNLRVVTIATGTYQISQITPLVTARLAVGARSDESKRLVLVYLATNDITQNQTLATIQARFTALFAAARSALGAGCRLAVFELNTSGVVTGLGTTAAIVNAWLATQVGVTIDKLLPNPDAALLHPLGQGHQDLADVLDAWLRQAAPELADTGRLKRTRPHWLARAAL